MRPSKLFLFLLAACSAWLPGRLAAQPLIIVEPVNHSAFQGDTSANFTVVAQSALAISYQWQVKSNGNFANIPLGDGNYSNSTASTLVVTINATTISTLNGSKYRCLVTDTNGTSTTFPCTLNAYPTPSVTPVVTVTPSSIAANSTANVSISVSGLAPNDTVRIRRFLDTNGNGKVDPGEPLVQSFVVTRGQAAVIGGIVDPDLPGDTNQSPGNLVCHFTIPAAPEIGRTSGNYVIHISSPTGEFSPILKAFTITQPNYGQSLSGQVTSNGSPTPNAGVIVLSPNGNHQTYIASAVSNTTGIFTVNAPPGNYTLVPFLVGFTGSLGGNTIALAAGQHLTGKNVAAITPATATITGQFVDPQLSGSALQGIQIFITSSSVGGVVLSCSDADGVFDAPVTAASDWDFQVSDFSTSAIGYFTPVNDPMFDTTSGNTSLYQNVSIPLTAANALIYGNVTNSSGVAIPNVKMSGSDNIGYNPQAYTDLSGNYFLLAVGPASGPPDLWNVNPSTDTNPALAGFITPPAQNANITAGQSAQLNFAAANVTNYFNGTVANNGVPVAGAVIDANANINGNFVNLQATTDSNGNFSIGASPGMWTLTLDNQSASSLNLVGASINVNPTQDGQNFNGIALPVTNGTASIVGGVADINRNPVTGATISATANVGNITYSAGAQTDNNGYYSFPVVNGTWLVSVDQPGYPDQLQLISGANETVNFNATPDAVFVSQPQNQNIAVGANTSFSVGLNVPSNYTIQWQVSANGGITFSNVTNNANFSGNNTTTLNVSNATLPPMGGPINATLAMGGEQFQCVVSFMLNGNLVTPTSNIVNLFVSTAPTFNINPGPQTVTAGQAANFTVNALGSPTPSLQWQISTDSGNNWSNITSGNFSGETTSTLTVTNITLAMNGDQFRVLAFNTFGTTPSGPGPLFVNTPPPPNITQSPTNQSTTAGQDAGFSANATGSPAPSFQWQISTNSGALWSNLTASVTFAGATTLDLVIMNATTAMNGDQFRLLAFNVNGTSESDPATLTVNGTSGNSTPNFSLSPAPQTVTAGEDAGFSASATGTPTPSFQWQLSTNSGGTWSNLTNSVTFAGVTTLDLVIMDANVTLNGDQFRVFAFNSAGNATSGPATLTVNGTSGNIIINSLGTSLGNQTVSGVTDVLAGQSVSLFASVSGPGTLSYQWLFGGKAISKATATNFTIGSFAAANAGNYSLVIHSSQLSSNTTSKALTLALGAKPAITTSPSNLTITLGKNAVFTVAASGTPTPTIQWQGSLDGGKTWGNISNGNGASGATTTTLTFTKPAASSSGDQLRAVATNLFGSATSKPATVIINAPPVIANVTVNPPPIGNSTTLNISSGTKVTFTVNATGNALKYQWQLNSKNISGATSSTYTITQAAAANDGKYAVVIKNTQGTTTSSSFTLNVLTKPTYTTEPTRATATVGKTATFKVVAAGNPTPTYQWEQNSNPLRNGVFNGVNISGVTNSTLTFGNVTSALNNTTYEVLLNNSQGNLTSSVVKLTVNK